MVKFRYVILDDFDNVVEILLTTIIGRANKIRKHLYIGLISMSQRGIVKAFVDMKKLWLFFRRFIYMVLCILTLIILIPINMGLILLSPFVICPIYFIFTGKSFFDSKSIDKIFEGTNIDDTLEWLYDKLLQS